MIALGRVACRLCGSCRSFRPLCRVKPTVLSTREIQIRGKKNFAALEDDENKVPGPMSSRYETFTDENSPIILDIEEERRTVQKIQEELQDEFEGINLECGVSGVFEIQEIVDILRREKAKDIFVCKIPEHCNYAEYLVVANGKSSRHMLAVLQFIRQIYKKKVAPNNQIPMLEGKNSTNWMAIDLGNIVVHIFSQKDRKTYDLETLWAVGREFDSNYQKNNLGSDSISTQYSNLLATLIPDTGKK